MLEIVKTAVSTVLMIILIVIFWFTAIVIISDESWTTVKIPVVVMLSITMFLMWKLILILAKDEQNQPQRAVTQSK